MIVRKGIINNKELQAVAGNWGKPTKQEHSPRHVAEQSEIARHRSKKQHLKIDLETKFYGCPFCGNILPIISKSNKHLWMDQRADKCSSCHARNKLNGCPACKRDAWYLKGMYKHKSGFGCGFVGKRKMPCLDFPLETKT